MARVFVSFGSNIHPVENVREALHRLAANLRVIAISTVYRTEPEDRPDQDPYYNGVVEAETDIPPRELKRLLREIEKDLGRKRSADKYAARTIDLDLILYEDLQVADDDLVLPDPLIRKRPFLAHPLYELAPDLDIPGAGPIRTIAAGLPRAGMTPLPEYTAELKKEGSHAFQQSQN